MKPMLIGVGAFLGTSVVAVVVAYALRTPDTSTPVGVTEFRISMPDRLATGVHTFTLTNHGTVAHELVIFRTDLAATDLPLKANGDVNEESPLLTSVADSGEPLAASGTETLKTAALTPGHYVAVCNLPGHYREGMRLDVTVP